MSDPSNAIQTIATIIVNYGCADYCVRAIQSILAESSAHDFIDRLSIVVVDNASPDDSVAQLQTAIDTHDWRNHVTLIAYPINGGFGAGCNVGMKHALDSDTPPGALYFMNPDAESTGHALQPLIAAMNAHPQCGMVGGAVLGDDGSVWTPGFRFPNPLSEFESTARTGLLTKLLTRYKVHRDIPRLTEVDWVGGFSFLVRTSLIDNTGMFDESFFLYYEETDWCYRAKANGWQLLAEPKSHVTHVGGASTGVGHAGKRVPPYWFHSRAWYFYKRGGWPLLILANIGWLVGYGIGRCKDMFKSGEEYRPAPHYLKDFLQHSFEIRPSTRTQSTGATT